MRYTFKIAGMHCKGCSNLIQLSLEEANFKDVDISLLNNTGQFTLEQNNINSVESDLTKIFNDLPGYSFSDLKQT